MTIIFKTLFPLLYRHKLKFILIFLFAFFSSGLKSLMPLMLNFLTTGWNDGNRKMALILPLILFFTWVFSSLFRYFQTFWLKMISLKTVSELRYKLMNKYLNSNLFLLKQFPSSTGGLMSRLISDLEQLYEGIGFLSEFIREPIFILCVFSYILYLSVPLGGFVILIILINFWIAKKVSKSLRKYGRQNQESMETLISHLKESLDGIRIIQAFNLQLESGKKFLNQIQYFIKTKEKVIFRETAISPIFNIVSFFFITCLIYYVNFLIFQKKFTVAEFTSSAAAIFMLINSLRNFQNSYIRLQQSAVSLNRFQKLMKAPLALTQKTPKKAFLKNWKEIEFKNVSFAYGQKKILQEISFKVKKNQMVAIVGESGSGKSTLINLLARFFDPIQGEILIDQIPLTHLPIDHLRENIALVSQEIFLFKDSVEKNIFIGRNQMQKPGALESDLSKYHHEIQSASKKAGAHEFIQKLEQSYKTQVGEFGSHLSGGERQRISIARAFFKNADILLLDEPTSALDSKSEKIIQKSLYQLIEGRTTFITSHRVSMTEKAQKILVLKKGFLVEEGLHEDLLEKKGEYFKLFQNSFPQ